eukprot:s1023_g24.t1
MGSPGLRQEYLDQVANAGEMEDTDAAKECRRHQHVHEAGSLRGQTSSRWCMAVVVVVVVVAVVAEVVVLVFLVVSIPEDPADCGSKDEILDEMHSILMKWGSLVSTSRALKRRAGPLRMLWDMNAYLSNAAGDDASGQTKTETLRAFDAAIANQFIDGSPRSSFPQLCKWLGALRLMRTCEQETEGLHRTVAQIKARAPNSTQAYISTETRLPAFENLFRDPLAVQELAVRHADLESGHEVAQAVAQLVGGRGCRAVPGLKHTDLIHLLYHSTFKFTRGATTEKVLPMSKADKLRRDKLPDMIVLHFIFVFLAFCMQGFRLVTGESLMDDIEKVIDAASDMQFGFVAAPSAEPLAGLEKKKGKKKQQPKAVSLKPAQYNETPLEPVAMEILDSDSDDDAHHHERGQSGPGSGTAAGLWTGRNLDDLVIFRIPHKHPHMLKRPLQHVDGLTYLDMAIRLYTVSAPSADTEDLGNVP